MTSWLALSEPVGSISVTVRLPRLKSKDERLRERAGAYVEASLLRHYGEKEMWRYEASTRVWVEIRLSERKAVRARIKQIPWWRPLERRRMLPKVLWTYGVPKWW